MTSTNSQTKIKIANIDEKKFVLSSFLAGAAAGAVAKTTIAPLDRTKINFQVSRRKRYSFKAAFKFVKQTYHSTGFLSLYRGNSATMARVMPYASIQFATHEQYKKFLKVDKDGVRTPATRYLSGSMAAVTATLFTYPLDTAKARLSVSQKSEYKNLRDVFVKEYKKFGFKTFYCGIYPTILGVIPYAGSSFYTYETCKIMYADNTGGAELTAVGRLLSGAFAGLVGQTSSYPLDIIRRRMQTGRIPRGQSILYSLYIIWLHEGIIHGLYKGLSMNWVKGPVAVGISFTTYDYINRAIQKLLNGFYMR